MKATPADISHCHGVRDPPVPNTSPVVTCCCSPAPPPCGQPASRRGRPCPAAREAAHAWKQTRPSRGAVWGSMRQLGFGSQRLRFASRPPHSALNKVLLILGPGKGLRFAVCLLPWPSCACERRAACPAPALCKCPEGVTCSPTSHLQGLGALATSHSSHLSPQLDHVSVFLAGSVSKSDLTTISQIQLCDSHGWSGHQEPLSWKPHWTLRFLEFVGHWVGPVGCRGSPRTTPLL